MTVLDVTGAVPGVVMEVELTDPLPPVLAQDRLGRRAAAAWVLVRVLSTPIGLAELHLPPAGLSPEQLADRLWERFRDGIRAHALRLGLGPVTSIPLGGFSVATPDRRETTAPAQGISVVVCTRDNPDRLHRCLESLLQQTHPNYEIVVVDNAPQDEATRCVVADMAARAHVRYLLEPVPGLSYARNRGYLSARFDLIAWIDDDEVADRYWLERLSQYFEQQPGTAAVSGVMLPAEVSTKAQEWFERFGGHNKGRGFQPAVFGGESGSEQSPLFPLPPFGTGGNMAMTREAIDLIGGFDVALGAGSPAQGAEDTLAFTKLLLAGRTVAYVPNAITWHYHRPDLAGLERQLYGYGVGLTAFYTALVLEDPRRLWHMLRLARRALAAMRGKDGIRLAHITEDFPVELLRVQRRGMLRGPAAYLRGRRVANRLHGQDAR